MKKSVLFAAIITAASLPVAKQSQAQQGFYVGAQAAPLLTIKFNGSDVNDNMDYKAKSSITYGINAGYNFTERLGIGVEVMYSKEKQRFEEHALGYDEKLQYIKVPVLFTYNSNPATRVMFTAKAGPSVGIMINSDISNATDASLNGSTKDKYKKINLGATFGLGARIRLTDRVYANAGLRFDGTITNLENRKYTGFQSGRASTHALNAGTEIGVRYYL